MVVEVWRMLHSTAGQLEYVISLGRSLQDLIQFCMDEEERINLNGPDPDNTSNTSQQGEVLSMEKVVSSSFKIIYLVKLLSNKYLCTWKFLLPWQAL